MPSKFLSNGVLRDLLSKVTPEERLDLTKIISPESKKPYDHLKLQREICRTGGHSVINFFRGQGTSYLDMVDDVVDKLKIDGLPSYHEEKSPIYKFDDISSLAYPESKCIQLGVDYAEKAEEKIILKILEISYKNMSPDERKNFDKQINEVAEKFGSSSAGKLAGASGLVVLGKLGGFATYTFLTTTMSAISFGTFGFGAYVTATTWLSYFLGPPGWIAIGTYGAYKLGQPNMEKVIKIVVGVGTIRQRLKYENHTG